MPAKKTLTRDVLPALWAGLEIDPREADRTLNRAVYTRIMTTSDTIVSKPVLDRMWKTLGASLYARPSPYADNVLILDVTAIKGALIAEGHPALVRTHIPHIYTHIPDAKEGSQ